MSLRRGLPWVAFGLVTIVGLSAWPFTVDDAFILARYARRIATGAGYTMNDGPPTDGVTGPLGLLPALVGELLCGNPVAGSKVAGILAAALATALVVRHGARDSAARGGITLVLATAGTLPVWAAGGLETGLATLALTIAGLAVMVEGELEGHRAAKTGAVLGGAVFALAWLRPELALASGVLLVALLARSRFAGGIALALAATGLLSVLAFRLFLFGSPLPLSAQAKPPDLGHGAHYVFRGLLVALGGGGLAVAWLGAREGQSGERILFGMLAAHLLALVLAGGDWMPGFRLFVPVIPLYALLAAAPIARRLHGRRLSASALFSSCALVPAVALVVQLPDLRQAGAARDSAGAELADWLAAHASKVAMVDAGYLAYRSGVDVIDLGGITDPRIGRLPGAHLDKHIDPGFLHARAPDAIVLHSSAPPRVGEDGKLLALAGYPIERRVAAMGWVRAQMRVARVVRYAPHYWYVVLVRRDAP